MSKVIHKLPPKI